MACMLSLAGHALPSGRGHDVYKELGIEGDDPVPPLLEALNLA
jgi:hypothetical protein